MNAPMMIDVLAVMREDALRAALDRQFDNEAEKRAADSVLAIATATNLLDWAEHALECISASKHPNTHAELRAAIASFKGGPA